MMEFNVCVNDTVQLLYISIIFLVCEKIVSLIDHVTWLPVYYISTKQILILQKNSKLTLYQIMK